MTFVSKMIDAIVMKFRDSQQTFREEAIDGTRYSKERPGEEFHFSNIFGESTNYAHTNIRQLFTLPTTIVENTV